MQLPGSYGRLRLQVADPKAASEAGSAKIEARLSADWRGQQVFTDGSDVDLTLRIAILTELFPPHVGGQEYRYLELSRQLSAMGHLVDVFTLRHDKDLPKEEVSGGVRIHRSLTLRGYLRQGSRSPTGVLAYSMKSFLDVLRQPLFDIYILNQWPVTHILAAEPFTRGVTIVDWVELWREGPIRTLQYLASKLPDGHMAVSEDIRSSLVNGFGVSPARIALAYSGVHVARYATSQAKEWGKIVFIGRLVRHKNVSLLIRAFKVAVLSEPSLELDIIGDGPEMQALRRIAGENHAIHFYGMLPEQEKMAILKKSWVLALPSEREGFPRVLTEAWAAATPVLVCNYPDNGATALVARWEAGLISEPSEQSIADSLLLLYSDEMRWRRLSQEAKDVAGSFDWRSIANRLAIFLYDLSCAHDRRNRGREKR